MWYKSNDICYLCKSNAETFEYMFWLCPVVNKLCYAKAQELSSSCRLNIQLNTNTFNLNKPKSAVFSH